jgi:hypothetical protein
LAIQRPSASEIPAGEVETCAAPGTPLRLALRPGAEYSVEVKKAGYATETVTIGEPPLVSLHPLDFFAGTALGFALMNIVMSVWYRLRARRLRLRKLSGNVEGPPSVRLGLRLRREMGGDVLEVTPDAAITIRLRLRVRQDVLGA